MTARSAGIALGSSNNIFYPDTYISGVEAQTIISRALDYVGQEDQKFGFSKGDLSYMLTPYTIRADIAKALYTLLLDMSTPEVSTDKSLSHNVVRDWLILDIGGSNYVPVEILRQIVPMLTVASGDKKKSESLMGQLTQLPIPMREADRVFLSIIQIRNGKIFVDVPSFHLSWHPVCDAWLHCRPFYFCDFSLTHTVTHTPKCLERDRKRQTGSCWSS